MTPTDGLGDWSGLLGHSSSFLHPNLTGSIRLVSARELSCLQYMSQGKNVDAPHREDRHGIADR